jgi:hypothetical protein
LVAHGDYSGFANFRIKISALFEGVSGNFRSISEFLFIPQFLAAIVMFPRNPGVKAPG